MQPTPKNVVVWFDEETEGLDDEELRVRGGINTATVGCVFLSVFSFLVFSVISLFMDGFTFKLALEFTS